MFSVIFSNSINCLLFSILPKTTGSAIIETLLFETITMKFSSIFRIKPPNQLVVVAVFSMLKEYSSAKATLKLVLNKLSFLYKRVLFVYRSCETFELIDLYVYLSSYAI